ncbi:ABC transporter permease [Streptomyces sp. NA04227]|uniref:ABC transporter permease n=1 Tax=Streptomyces sp. NA04227 TaxID=2742136 RepID=UPI0015921719|nr:ABC transporter permease [Streptomyces sp. NA04227]QKW08019.1 ABC transporter permease [Streptomyces sp. NA04227]
MRDVLRAEWLKAWSGRTWWIMLLVGLFLGLLGASGAAAAADVQIDDGTTDAVAGSAEVVRAWFSTLLASMLFGAVFVTREYGAGAISRSVLLSGSRSRLLAAKTLVGTGMGALLAAVATLCAPLSLWLFFPMFGIDAHWSRDASLTLLGVFAVITLAAPWGVLLGWILRNQAATIATLLVVTLFVDEGLHALLPEAGRFTMQVAMGTVYRDDKNMALDLPYALLVIAAWLALAGFTARRLFTRRDVT